MFDSVVDFPHLVLAGLRGSYSSDSEQETVLGTIR